MGGDGDDVGGDEDDVGGGKKPVSEILINSESLV